MGGSVVAQENAGSGVAASSRDDASRTTSGVIGAAGREGLEQKRKDSGHTSEAPSSTQRATEDFLVVGSSLLEDARPPTGGRSVMAKAELLSSMLEPTRSASRRLR
eukprot:38576-Pleurochrysis_carterae.AAC.3